MKESKCMLGKRLTKEIYLDLSREEWERLSEVTFKLKPESGISFYCSYLHTWGFPCWI